MSKKSKKLPLNPLLAVLLVVGSLFIVSGVISNIPILWTQLITKVETPTHYDFKIFDSILKKYVQKGLVDYAKLKADGGVDQALSELARISPAALKTPEERLCYWVNAHNLLTMKLVLDKYPIRATTAIGQPSGLRQFLVGGKVVSVQKLRLELLPEAIDKSDWRGIFLICDASLGGPEIGDSAYQADSLSTKLAEACHRFVSSPAHFRLDAKTSTISISPFFRWNKAFIESKYPSSFDLVADYLPGRRLIDIGKLNRNYGIQYDLRLNDLRWLEELKAQLGLDAKSNAKQEAELGLNAKPDSKLSEKQEAKPVLDPKSESKSSQTQETKPAGSRRSQAETNSKEVK